MAIDLQDLFSEYERDKKAPPAKMWGEVIPDMSQFDQGKDSGPGVAGVIGKLAQIGGTIANFIPGGQVVGVPLTMGGAALEGADKGGVGGAVKAGLFSGAQTLAPMGINEVVKGLKTPVDTGAFTAFSSKGSPLTVPGTRTNPIEVFSSQGSPMTAPASPKEYPFGLGGGS